MRMIDADALIDAINKWMPKDQETWMDSDLPPIENLVVSIMMTIEEQPTVDVIPVRYGKWEMKPDPFGFFDDIPVCSECGCTTKMRDKTKYCPNCGAKMETGHE